MKDLSKRADKVIAKINQGKKKFKIQFIASEIGYNDKTLSRFMHKKFGYVTLPIITKLEQFIKKNKL